MVNAANPQLTDNFKVCLLTGTCMNPLAIMNEEFGIMAMNCYRINRYAEMYQWKEVRHTRTVGSGDNRRTETYYTHHQEWASHKIDSNMFHERWGHENPNIDWPFLADEQEAAEVNIGMTFLKTNTVTQLGR